MTNTQRDNKEDSGTILLNLLKGSFDTSTDTITSAVYTSFGISAAIFLIFCLIRPHNSVVYAPKLRQSDPKHAPPKVGKGFFSWITPLVKMREADLIDKIGLDAAIFLRFLRMLRLMFAVLSIGGLVLIGVNVSYNLKVPANDRKNASVFSLMSPRYLTMQPFYAHLIMSYVFDIIICYFLYHNYKRVVGLKKKFYEDPDYQNAAYARTLMVTNVPKAAQSDVELAQIVARIQNDPRLAADEKVYIARDVKELPLLIEQYEKTVRELESVLTKYLRQGAVASRRPTMKPFKDDRHNRGGVKIDAIEYLDTRMKALETRIKEIRKSVDLKTPLPYGFVSYSNVQLAHSVAFKAKGKHPNHTRIFLAPQPHDILWKNAAKSKSKRRRNNAFGWMLFIFLSITWVVPNAFIATFLANFDKIGALWPQFMSEKFRHPQLYALVQGFAAPLVLSLFYLLLPVLMRRISAWQGKLTKTKRERNVVSKLYVFFVFNNLILFTVYGTLWAFIAGVVQTRRSGKSISAIDAAHQLRENLVDAVFGTSVFWVSYLLQRNLGALLDLAQIVTLLWRFFIRRLGNPTPREMIEWTAPQNMDVAAYYNYFLFYATIALVFAPIQPIILFVAAFYFTIDSWLRKYAYMYVYVTRVESGGGFWRLIFNRMLFATGFANFITGVVIWSRFNRSVALGVVPLLILLVGFKFYCRQSFDDDLHYYLPKKDIESSLHDANSRRNDKLAKRYGHPALTKPLITPLVDEKYKHLLAQVYSIRVDEPEAYSNAYGTENLGMTTMQKSNVGQPVVNEGIDQFKFVAESQMDYANLEDHRSEFNFPLYDQSRPDTPMTLGRATPEPRSFVHPGDTAESRNISGQYVESASAGGAGTYQNTPLSPGFNSRARPPYLNRGLTGSQSDLTGLLAEPQAPGALTPARIHTPGIDGGPDLGRQYHNQSPYQPQQYQPSNSYFNENQQYHNPYMNESGRSTPYQEYRR